MDGFKFHVEIVGNNNGNPVYVFHTSPFDHMYLMKSLKSEANYNFHFFDLPNHGNSEPTDLENLSFMKIAKAVEEYRKSNEHQEIHVIGHGIGGFIAQTYATRFKNSVLSLIICNSAPNSRYRTEMAWNIRDRLSKVVKQKMSDLQGETDAESLRFRFKSSLPAYFTNEFHSQADELIDGLDVFPSDSYVTISNYMIPKYDVRDGLQSFQHPVLIIIGTHDVWPENILDLYKIDVPHAKVVKLNSGHFPMIEQPEAFWNTVLAFLKENSK